MLYNGRHEIPRAVLAITGIGNVLLQGLNWFWLVKMVASVRKRFTTLKTGKHQTARRRSPRLNRSRGIMERVSFILAVYELRPASLRAG
ncbi:hypothetical protein C8R44DRAFT_765897 [Mycena epipterygia]|nr:hypothetical protein C8R44DRAFT_765897 [Mycena epipterygia]